MVEISKILNDKIVNIRENAFPNEVCGVLIGKVNNEDFKILDFKVCKNLNEQRSIDRYNLDPRDYMKAQEYAEKKNLDIIGIYHSHPNHPAIASKTDNFRAWPSYVYLIYSIYEEEFKDLTGWVLNEKEGKLEKTNIVIP